MCISDHVFPLSCPVPTPPIITAQSMPGSVGQWQADHVASGVCNRAQMTFL